MVNPVRDPALKDEAFCSNGVKKMNYHDMDRLSDNSFLPYKIFVESHQEYC
jgi:hypothetical protein